MQFLTRPVAHLSSAYCGPPPTPANIWWRWNLDPVLIAVLLALLAAYAAGAWRINEVAARKDVLFVFGWIITTLGLISPLCPLSVALFSARVGQHVLLTLIAAPLLVAADPGIAYSGLLPPHWRKHWAASHSASPTILAGVFAALMWLWHAPNLYSATFSSTIIYWLMHLSLFGAALWLWASLLDSRPSVLVRAMAASIISSVQMGFLGAVIMFAPHPWYVDHALTTMPWGLTRLQDQQLGAAIMWAPGCMIFVGVSVFALWRILARADWADSRAQLSSAHNSFDAGFANGLVADDRYSANSEMSRRD